MPIVKSDGKIVAFLVFNQIIARFEIPSEIFTDHGSHFQKEMMEELASKLGFKHGHSSSYYFYTNGQVSQDHFAKNCQLEKIRLTYHAISCYISHFGHTEPWSRLPLIFLLSS